MPPALVKAETSELAAVTLYFVVAEALANTHKHARAESVDLSVEQANGVLRARFRDDGIGGAVDGFGLLSLRDRVAAAGGTSTVTSPRGAGTAIGVELPCASS